jgi:hypothetical protein
MLEELALKATRERSRFGVRKLAPLSAGGGVESGSKLPLSKAPFRRSQKK